MDEPTTVVALFGPTGVGKTAVAAALAQRLRARGEADPIAVSADALQVYEGLGALTGVASAQEQRLLEHRLVGFVPVTEEFSVGEFMPLAHAQVDAALAAGRRPIVVGGTGLYLRAALCDLDLAPTVAPEVRERLEAELAARGPEALHARLEKRAPKTAAAVNPKDRSRILRALELLEVGATPARAGDSQLWTAEMRRPTVLAGLTMERDALYERIGRRVDAIVAAGGADEARRAGAAGASRTARAALGFEELLVGDVEMLKRRTRNYAKRQLSWIRKLGGLEPIDVTGRASEEVAAEVGALVERSEGEVVAR